MINLKKVTMRNFKSFGNAPTEVTLDKKGSVLILGDNQDVGEKGTSANGVGKTTLMAAIVFALYGKDLENSKLKPDELVNLKNKKNMIVELFFELKGIEYRIVRGRKPSILEFYADDTSLTRDSMKNTDNTIASIIGIDYDMFLSVYFLNTFRPTFMSLGSAGQRDFLENVLGLDVLAARAEALKLMKKDFNVDLKLAQKDLDSEVRLQYQYDDNVKWISDKVDNFENKRASDIESLTADIEHLSLIDYAFYLNLTEKLTDSPVEKLLSQLKSDASVWSSQLGGKKRELEMTEKANSSVSEWEESHADKLSSLKDKVAQYPSLEDIELRDNTVSQISAIDSKIIGIQDQQRKITSIDVPALEKEQQALEKEFQYLDAGKCPYCQQSHTDNDRITQIETEFSELDDRIDKLGVMLKSLDDSLAQLFEEHDQLKTSLPDIPRDCTAEKLARLTDDLERESIQTNPYTYTDTSSLVKEIIEIEDKIKEKEIEIEQASKEDSAHKEEQEKIISQLMDGVGTKNSNKINELKQNEDELIRKLEEVKNADNPYQQQLQEMEECTADVKSKTEAVEEIEKDIKHADYMIKLLTDPKSFIRKNIVDQYLPYLNKKIYEYSRMVGSIHVAEINNDMTVDIEYMGGVVSYFTMSRGERFRIDVATTMAFRDLMRMMGKAVNVLFVDEVLDNSLDPHGTQKVFELITSLSSSTFLISHRVEFETLVDSVMTISKRNGFTSIN